MGRNKFVAIAFVVLLTASAFSAIPVSVWAANKPQANFVLDGMDIFARPKLEIHRVFLGNDSSNDNGTSLQNLTGTSIDVMRNYTFAVKLADRDQTKPNITNMHNVTLVAFVSFEKDPGATNPWASGSKYNHRNYEFQFNATRKSGGGNVSSLWNLTMNYPSMASDAEVKIRMQNSSWINESDSYKGGGIPGTDGQNDTIEIRWSFQLGFQCRNTNSSGNASVDDWIFYATATDVFDITNSSKGKWNQRFDVFQHTELWGSGSVAGREVPGGDAFKLDVGTNLYHLIHYSVNNNASFWVNASSFHASWHSDTLKLAFNDTNVTDSVNWTKLGPNYKYVGNISHPFNGTRSYESPSPGQGESGTIYWMCTGIPIGTSSGKYSATLYYRIRLEGT